MVTQFSKQLCSLKKGGFSCFLLIVLMLSLTGCVSKGTHEALIQERDRIIAVRDQVVDQRNQLLAENARLSTKVKLTEEEKMQVAKEAAAAKMNRDRYMRILKQLLPRSVRLIRLR